MTQELNDIVGRRGELLFELAILEYHGLPHVLFRASFLGDKWPAADYVVELENVPNSSPAMFVQVKATSQQLGQSHIEISLPPDKRDALFRITGPTYLVGVHEPSKKAYILSVHQQSPTGIYRIPLTHELHLANLQRLYDEVKTFWQGRTSKPINSVFS